MSVGSNKTIGIGVEESYVKNKCRSVPSKVRLSYK